MQVHVERFAREVVVEHDLAADKGLERQRGEHVEAEAQARDVDHGVVRGEVVEHVAQGLVAEGEEAGEGHEEAGEHGDACGEVGDSAEAVDGWCLEGTVDEEGVVVADESYMEVIGVVISIWGTAPAYDHVWEEEGRDGGPEDMYRMI